jgi:hypothetical protein
VFADELAGESLKLAPFLIGLLLGVGVLVGGCHNRRTYYQAPSIDGFRFGAHATIAGRSADTLRVSATAENVSDHQLREERGSCYMLNRLAIVAQAHTKTWDSKTWEISQLRQPPFYYDSATHQLLVACAGVGFERIVPPGGLVTYELRIPIKRILGDSLAPGKYRISARIAINGRETGVLPAGEVELRVPPA